MSSPPCGLYIRHWTLLPDTDVIVFLHRSRQKILSILNLRGLQGFVSSTFCGSLFGEPGAWALILNKGTIGSADPRKVDFVLNFVSE